MSINFFKYIFVDFNNLFWRIAIRTFKKYLKNENEEIDFSKATLLVSEIIQGILSQIKDFKNKFGLKDCNVYFCFDNPFSKINLRKLIDSSYKHNRKRMPEEFYKVLEIVEQFIKNYDNNFYIIRCNNLEADDLVNIIKNKLILNENNQCLVISTDLDWARNIEKYTKWYNYTEIIGEKEFELEHGFYPTEHSIKMYKSICGDNSDSIPNAVPYLPKSILFDIIKKFNNIPELLKCLGDTSYPTQWKIKIKEAEIRLKINYQLVDFIKIENENDLIFYKCEENKTILRKWFEMLNIPLESKLYDSKKDSFFQPKKIKRIKPIFNDFK